MVDPSIRALRQAPETFRRLQLPILTQLWPPIPQTLHFVGCTAWWDELQSPEAATPMHRYRCFNV